MITIELLRSLGACWTDAEIANFAAGCTSMSPREIATHRDITIDDRLWVLCHALEHRNPAAARAFAIDAAARVSHLAGGERDQAEHARLVADLRRIFALPSELRVPEFQTWDSAWAVGRYASKSAAWGAPWAASKSAAWNAAWDAASNTAWHALLSAAGAEGAATGGSAGAELLYAVDVIITALGADADGWTDDREA